MHAGNVHICREGDAGYAGAMTMLRVMLIVLALLATAWLVVRVAREARESGVDWSGVALAAVFVGLAVYLRHATEVGGLL
jgi:hypothetical protein